MRGDAVDDRVALAVTLDQVRADHGVRAFHFMADGLADVMQQAGSFGDGHIQPKLGRHQAHQLRDFDRVIQNVLRKAPAKMQPPEQFHNLRMHRLRTRLGGGLIAEAHNHFIHLRRRLGHHLLDARRMNPSVLDQPRHGRAGDLAAHRIETGDHHRARRVVHEDRDARGRFKRPDVAAFTPDDATLDFIARQRQGCRRVFRRVIAGIALDGHTDDAPRLIFGMSLGLV